MLLYVSTGEGQDREPRPLHAIPDTVSGLYLLGMREHLRAAVMLHAGDGGWLDTPDWRFDRHVIRLALYAREQHGVEKGQWMAVLGPLDPLWIAAEFAALGWGATCVGLAHTLSDQEVRAALDETAARVAVATDLESARRLLALRREVPTLETVLAPAGAGEGAVDLGEAVDLAANLDTPERAQAFRASASSVEPDRPALWHYAPGSGGAVEVSRLTHREAMARVRERLTALPARRGERAYFESRTVSAAVRLAIYAFVGDGYTTIVLGRPGRAAEDFAAHAPARILASSAWLEELHRDLDTVSAGAFRDGAFPLWRRLRAALAARRLRRRVRERTGGQLRLVESLEAAPASLGPLLGAAGVTLAQGKGEQGA